MGIPVIFSNGEIGNVHRHTLDYLIRENEVVAFRRSEGWVSFQREKLATQPEEGSMAYVRVGKEIQIIFKDGVARNIPIEMLDQLIREKMIIAFRRADGWVNVGRDPLRKYQRLGNR